MKSQRKFLDTGLELTCSKLPKKFYLQYQDKLGLRHQDLAPLPENQKGTIEKLEKADQNPYNFEIQNYKQAIKSIKLTRESVNSRA